MINNINGKKTPSRDECDFYERNGYMIVDDFLKMDEISCLCSEVERMKNLDSPGKVIEEKSGVVRALNGCHLESDIFDRLTKLDRFLRIARSLIDYEVYVYQFKINFKEAFDGEIWEWHQDYSFWKFEDKMPQPDAINIAILLDDVTEFNGPLILIPGSHRLGLLGEQAVGNTDLGCPLEDGFSVKLKYSIDRDQIELIENEFGMIAPKGKSGSVIVFNPNIVHGSGPNISSRGRRLLIITYNSVGNAPDESDLWRPEFLVGRNCEPICGIGDSLFDENTD